jgi:hypothetical protein
VLGRRGGQVGPTWADARARKEKEKASGLGCLRAEVGPAGEMRERERGRKGFPFFFFLLKNSFQIHFSNIQTSNKQKSMQSNHDAQTLIISKLF